MRFIARSSTRFLIIVLKQIKQKTEPSNRFRIDGSVFMLIHILMSQPLLKKLFMLHFILELDELIKCFRAF